MGAGFILLLVSFCNQRAEFDEFLFCHGSLCSIDIEVYPLGVLDRFGLIRKPASRVFVVDGSIDADHELLSGVWAGVVLFFKENLHFLSGFLSTESISPRGLSEPVFLAPTLGSGERGGRTRSTEAARNVFRGPPPESFSFVCSYSVLKFFFRLVLSFSGIAPWTHGSEHIPAFCGAEFLPCSVRIKEGHALGAGRFWEQGLGRTLSSRSPHKHLSV